jgi:hypothetical protein
MVTSFEIPKELHNRVKPLLSGTQTVSQFARSAFEEKINRLEKRDEQARKKLFERDVELIKPIVAHIIKDMQK